MRLIDADALINKYQSEIGIDVFVHEVIEDLCEAPTIDAEPVIRCKDCKYRDGDICIGFGDGHYVDKEGFCNCAERKEE